jgi:hypothetical protein
MTLMDAMEDGVDGGGGRGTTNGGGGGGGGWLSSLFGGGEASAVPPPPTPPSGTPRGLYMYGGVGTGKTMLMDLFVEAVGGLVPVRCLFPSFNLLHSFFPFLFLFLFFSRDDEAAPKKKYNCCSIRCAA